jgi:hypothetical protein
MAFAYSPKIVTDGLVFLYDAKNPKSYPGSGTIWYDISGNGNHATIDGATFNTDEFQFDGLNDSLSLSSTITTTPSTGFSFWAVWDLPTQSSSGWNYFLLSNPAGSHKYEFGKYGTSADSFNFKDNIEQAGTSMTTNIGSGYASYAFGTTSDGYSFTSVNGAAKTIKNPGINDYWATAPTYDMEFSNLFTGQSTYFASNCKMLALYNRELTDTELVMNDKVAYKRK